MRKGFKAVPIVALVLMLTACSTTEPVAVIDPDAHIMTGSETASLSN